LPDHSRRAPLFRSFGDGGAAFFVTDSLVQDQPDQPTLPMGNGPDGLIVSQTREGALDFVTVTNAYKPFLTLPHLGLIPPSPPFLPVRFHLLHNLASFLYLWRPVDTDNSVRINQHTCGTLIADLVGALSLLTSTSQSKDWKSLPRPVVECIKVLGVCVAKESGFDQQKFSSARSRRSGISTQEGNVEATGLLRLSGASLISVV